MRKKNDRVIVPLAILKSCDFFFFGQINDGCQATHRHTHTHTHTKEKKRGGKHCYALIKIFFKKRFVNSILILSL